MPKIEMVDQRSPQWIAMKRGVPSASQAHRLLTPAKRLTYARELLAEQLTDTMPEQFVTPQMQRGIDLEPTALDLYCLQRDVEVDQVGFVWSDDWPDRVGVSPDGLVDPDGLVEVKCPSSARHIEYLLDGAPAEYIAQMQMQMLVVDRPWCDFVSFDDRVDPMHALLIRRYERDPKMEQKLREGIEEVLGLLEQWRAELEKRRAA